MFFIRQYQNKIAKLEEENNEFRNIINSNITIIESLKKSNINLQTQLNEKEEIQNSDEELLKTLSEKEEELESLNAKFQEFEQSNKQLSDLIVELKLKDEETLPIQNLSIESPSPSLFFRMYKKLSNVSQNQIVKHLIDNLKSTNRDTKAYSIKILSVIKGQRIFEALTELVDEKDWIIKLYLIKALRNFENPEVTDILKTLQRDSDTDVREAATEMLSRLNC